MHRSYSFLLLPLGLVIGYGTGSLTQTDIESTADQSTQPPIEAATYSVYEDKKQLWRSRVLDLLEEPSFTLQTALYYTFAQKISPEDMPYVLEGMYPEGWTRFRGDLPLAIFMEWAKRDSSGLAVFSTQLHKQYPDLDDNLDSIFFNLGLQNAPGSVSTLEQIPEGDTRDNFVSQFLNGLDEDHSDQLFNARLRLLGPKLAFANLSEAQLEVAIQEFWTNATHYLDTDIIPSPYLAIEIGKRYQDKSIQILKTSPKIGPILIGTIASSGSLSQENDDLLNETWFNWHEIENFLTPEEKNTVLKYLSTQDQYWRTNQSSIGFNMLAEGLDRELTQTYLSLPSIPNQTRKLILNNSTHLFSQTEFFDLLSQVDQSARSSGLHSLLSKSTSEESIRILDSLPTDWNEPELVNTAFEKAVKEGNLTILDEISKRFPEHRSYLPENEITAKNLWDLNPELYLKNLEALPPHTKEHHLQMIAANAAEEELGLILEHGSFDQQTDVLIGLIHENPVLSTEILKHESPDAISSEQASRIGVSLAYAADKETALSYFSSNDIDHNSSQIAVLNYCLSEILLDEEEGASQKISHLSTKHDYLYRTAKALTLETDDPEQLINLKREDPKTFINAFTSLIGNASEDSLRLKARNLLASSALTNQEKLAIHNALYGGYRP